jgi:putative DNA primase/helicase
MSANNKTEKVNMMVGYILNLGHHFVSTLENNFFYIWDAETGLYKPEAEVIIARELVKEFTADASISTIREVVNQIKYLKVIPAEYMDANNLLGVKNGAIDIHTREFYPKSPDNYITRCINVEYQTTPTTCLKIDKFIKSIVAKEDVELMYELIAYCLYNGYPLQNFFILYGTGRNGKSVFLKLLTTFLGDGNVSNLDINTILTDQFATCDLYMKMANVYGDLSDKALNETGMLKDLTGDAKVRARQLYSKSFTFWNTCKLIYACNRIPKVKDNTDAFHRRVIIIDFPNQFDGKDANPKILEDLIDATEFTGLLNICLEKIDKLLESGFSYTTDINKRRKMYSYRSDSFDSFIEEEPFEFFPNDGTVKMRKEDVFKTYQDFCNEKKFTPENEKGFWKRWWNTVYGTIEKRITAEGVTIRYIQGVALNVKKGVTNEEHN